MTSTDQPQTNNALKVLSGPDRVAALVLALGKPHATKVLKRFDPEELRLVARAIAGLRPVAAPDLERLVEDFARTFADGGAYAGTLADMQNLLSDVMTEDQIAEAMSDGSDAPPPLEPVWPKLAGLKADLLGAYLLVEHPQTAAFVLSKVDTDVSAKIIETFTPELRSAIVVRMLGVGQVAQEVEQAVQDALREDLLGSGNSRHGEIADILNKLDKEHTELLLAVIEKTRPDDAKALKGMLFSFEDVVTLKKEHRTALFESVPMERVILALSGLEADFQQTVLSSLGARAKRMAEAELQGGNQASAAEVEKARRAIVATVLAMIAAGEITRSPAGGEDGAAP